MTRFRETSNIELPAHATGAVVGRWALDVGCWMFPQVRPASGRLALLTVRRRRLGVFLAPMAKDEASGEEERERGKWRWEKEAADQEGFAQTTKEP